ncbi:MAG: hypothetical protein ACLFVU_08570 [Phycisphaerae bacterium]
MSPLGRFSCVLAATARYWPFERDEQTGLYEVYDRHPGKFFPDGGHVLLDVSTCVVESFHVYWLDILACEWADQGPCRPELGWIRLSTSTEDGYWAAFIAPAG